MKSPKLRHRAARSRQRAINYIVKTLAIGKARMAAWYICRPTGKMSDSDLYKMEPAQ